MNSSENTAANGKLSTNSIRNALGNVKARGKGGVYYGYQGQWLNKLHLTAAQRVAVDFSERLVKKWGMTFYFYESQPDGLGRRVYRDKNGNWVRAEDGFYDPSDGSIHIDLNAGTYGQGAILFTVAHELTHHIQQWSPDAYHKLCDILTQGYLGAGQPLGIHVQLRQQLAQEAGRALTYKEAYDEVIAHSLESVLADGKVMQLLEQIEAEDKTLAARVRRFFRDVAQLIWETVDTYWGLQPDSPEGRMVQQMKKLGAELEDAFAHGLYQAGQNFSQSDKSAAQAGNVKYQARQSHKDSRYLDPRTVTKTDVLEMLNNVASGQYHGRTYIPIRISTPGIVQERLFAQNRPMAMPVSKVLQAMKEDQGYIKGKNLRGHGLSVDDMIQIIQKMDSPDYLYSQDSNDRGIAVIKHETDDGTLAVVVDFDCHINPAYLNGYEADAYNVAVTSFNIDGGMFGLFQYAKDKGWREIFNKEKEGDPAKKFPATRPFAVEQDSLDENIPYSEQTVKANNSTQYRYSGRQDLRQKNSLAAAIRDDVVYAHEAFLQEMTSRGIDQRNAKLAVSALLDAAYNRATQRQIDFLRYMRTESPYAAQYNAAMEAVFPGSTGTLRTVVTITV